MKNTKKWKKVTIAAALGLMIGVQGMVPVKAAEAMPMELVRCSCGTAVNVDVSRYKIGERFLGECDQPDHIKGHCFLYEITYRVIESYVCPKCNHRVETQKGYAYETIHVDR